MKTSFRTKYKTTKPLELKDLNTLISDKKFKSEVYAQVEFFLEERFGPGIRRSEEYKYFIFSKLERSFDRVYVKLRNRVLNRYYKKYHIKQNTHDNNSLLNLYSQIVFDYYVDLITGGSTSDGYGGIYNLNKE